VEKETQEANQITLKPGEVLGEKYVLDRMIGKGGMAVVWAGTNKRTGKRVALKVIRRSFVSNSEAAELFRREALAASRVNHPNVVNVFDVVDHGSMTCIVMELLDGEPLNEYLARKGQLSVEEAAALLLPAMRGVAAANAQGVIHRDLKPQNVFLCVGPDGRLVTTKVLDFGISVIMEKAIGSAVATVQLATLGTPAYMSPEHIAGAPHIDERADVYGFGVLLYEALAGQHPFPGALGPSLFMRILHEPPPALSSLRPDLPSEVVQIIECAMSKEPGDRFSNLDPFIRAVEDHLLPSSTLPRNMTPMAGVPVYPLSESKSGVADAVVQVARRAEGSGLHETKALYNLPRASAAGLGESSPKNITFNRAQENTPLVSASIDQLPTIGREIRRFFAKPLVAGLLFAAVLIAVVWLAFPVQNHQGAQKNAPPSPPSKPATARARPAVPGETARPSVVLPPPSVVGPGELAPEASLPRAIGEVAPPQERAAPLPAKSLGAPRHLSVAPKGSLPRAAHTENREPPASVFLAPVQPPVSIQPPSATPDVAAQAPTAAHRSAATQPSPAAPDPAAQAPVADQPSTAPQAPATAQPPAPVQSPAKRAGSLSPDDF
jgi:serine/threonine-protein kinase